jgi:pSer/pThr/pTyr-binding forkhead associated (FHA) protein
MGDDGDSAVPLLLADSPEQRPIALVGRHPLLVGRDRGCDVAITDPYVSRHHMLVWYDGGKLRVRDCGSALGTKVGRRNVGPGEALAVKPDERILLADRVPLTWGSMEERRPAEWSPAGLVVRAGPGWRVADGLLPPNARPDAIDAPTALDTTLPGQAVWWADVAPEAQLCSLTISMAGGLPDRARFDQAGGGMVTVGGEARVVLLFLLAGRRQLFDRGGCESAWVHDHDLAVGLWGSRGKELPPSRLNTMVARVREQLEKANLDRTLIEKQPRATRLGHGIGAIAIQGVASGRLPSLPRT